MQPQTWVPRLRLPPLPGLFFPFRLGPPLSLLLVEGCLTLSQTHTLTHAHTSSPTLASQIGSSEIPTISQWVRCANAKPSNESGTRFSVFRLVTGNGRLNCQVS